MAPDTVPSPCARVPRVLCPHRCRAAAHGCFQGVGSPWTPARTGDSGPGGGSRPGLSRPTPFRCRRAAFLRFHAHVRWRVCACAFEAPAFSLRTSQEQPGPKAGAFTCLVSGSRPGDSGGDEETEQNHEKLEGRPAAASRAVALSEPSEPAAPASPSVSRGDGGTGHVVLHALLAPAPEFTPDTPGCWPLPQPAPRDGLGDVLSPRNAEWARRGLRRGASRGARFPTSWASAWPCRTRPVPTPASAAAGPLRGPGPRGVCACVHCARVHVCAGACTRAPPREARARLLPPLTARSRGPAGRPPCPVVFTLTVSSGL